jgi:chromatin remodeling complex protein RSC6
VFLFLARQGRNGGPQGENNGTIGGEARQRRNQGGCKEVKATGKPAGGPRGGITAPVTPSADLAEIVGKKDLPRSEVVKKMWEYIKKHDLQDAKDRRQINADDKLEKIFSKKSVSMFEMNKHLSAHLTAPKT